MQALRSIELQYASAASLFFFTVNTALFYVVYRAFKESSLRLVSFNTLLILLSVVTLSLAITVFYLPPIEIYDFLMDSGRVLLNHQNPYSAYFPNIYFGTSYADHFQNPHYARPTLDVFGYLPGLFPLSVLGYLLGDIRYLFLGLHLWIFFLMLLIAGRSFHLAYLYLLNPINPYLLISSFVDVYAIFFFALLTYALLRGKSFLLVASIFGLVLSKQYALFVPFLLHRFLPNKNLLAGAFLASLVYLLFLVWDSDAFLHDTLYYHFSLPRVDGLTLLSFFKHTLSYVPTRVVAISFVLFLLFGYLTLRETKLASAIRQISRAYFSFFFFAKAAFINYYYFALGFLLFSLIVTAQKSGVSNESSEIATIR